jgi:hypothetical protein
VPKPILVVMNRLSMISAWFAGAIGAVAAWKYGPVLGMGLQMWTGNTEPRTPELAYPWWATAGTLLGTLVLVRMKREGWAHVVATLSVFPPLWHLYACSKAAGG